ncbi:uncharacterized protein LOC123557134 isoform X2 [Mercenaria mercenaria]|uniref:uncharacterized protein LOC123557134 isoform X2 n=1 Tax=Mercenaria mercenaria TaxID=6596 RepID=UPI00234E3EBC|nr:uncharacterized protein LOC123557134 isoform X2 [Mercenaria mercenaria]
MKMMNACTGVLLYLFLTFEGCKSDMAGDRSRYLISQEDREPTCKYFCNTVNDTERFVPPMFIDNCPPRDLSQSYIVPPGKNHIVVKWTEPVATDKNGDKPLVKQVMGIKNGASFNGSVDRQRHYIVYLAIDKDGLKDNCYFVFSVEIPKCPSLGIVDNGHYRCTEGRAPGSSCMFTCNAGFKLIVTGNITCDYNTTTIQAPVWSGVRRCERVHCNEPNEPANAVVSCTNSTYGYQSVCSVQCVQGYTPSGPLYIMCQEDGYWSEMTRCLKNEANEFQCSSAQCNGHTCILNLNQQVTCNCSHGWSGSSCDIPPDYCEDNICMNNGTCMNHYWTYNCSCDPGYSGILCQICPVDGGWSDWSVWSSCSVTCGSGNRIRVRSCDSPPPDQHGKPCLGEYTELRSCNMDNCKVCPLLGQLNELHSSYECNIYDNYGQEACQISCRNGTILLPQFTYFRELLCGWPTNYEWLPGNVQSPCVDPANPEGLKLKTEIAYINKIPTEQQTAVAEQVFENLQETSCFTSSLTNCTAITEFSSTSNQLRNVTKLTITFHILLETVIRKRSYDRAEAVDSSLTDAITVLESTADYIKNFTDDIFNVKLGGSYFTADRKSLNVSASTDCRPGHVPVGAVCVICPARTYFSGGSCQLCDKGTFQDLEGQSWCKSCPAGKTTATVGASNADQCYVPSDKVNILDEIESIVTTVVAVVTPIVTLIVAIPSFIKVYLKCREKGRCRKSKEEKLEEKDLSDISQKTADGLTDINKIAFYRGRELKLMEGSIVNVKADAIVNPTDKTLLKGVVAEALKRECGDHFIKGVKKLLGKIGTLKASDVEISECKGIPANNVIHVNVKNLDISNFPTDVATDDQLKNVIRNVMDFAEKRSIETIALPPLINKSNMREREAEIILKTVIEYFHSKENVCESCEYDYENTVCTVCEGGGKIKTVFVVLSSVDGKTVNTYRHTFEKELTQYQTSGC